MVVMSRTTYVCSPLLSVWKFVPLLIAGYETGLYLSQTSSKPVFRGEEVRARDLYLACVGRKMKEGFEHYAIIDI